MALAGSTLIAAAGGRRCLLPRCRGASSSPAARLVPRPVALLIPGYSPRPSWPCTRRAGASLRCCPRAVSPPLRARGTYAHNVSIGGRASQKEKQRQGRGRWGRKSETKGGGISLMCCKYQHRHCRVPCLVYAQAASGVLYELLAASTGPDLRYVDRRHCRLRQVLLVAACSRAHPAHQA